MYIFINSKEQISRWITWNRERPTKSNNSYVHSSINKFRGESLSKKNHWQCHLDKDQWRKRLAKNNRWIIVHNNDWKKNPDRWWFHHQNRWRMEVKRMKSEVSEKWIPGVTTKSMIHHVKRCLQDTPTAQNHFSSRNELLNKRNSTVKVLQNK